MPIQLLDPAEPATPAAVSDAERRLGFALPRDFKVFLETVSNGGQVQPVFVGLAESPVGLVAFLGVGRGDDLDLETRIRQYRGRLPAQMIPIGDAEGGNLLLQSTSPDEGSAVWFWDHEFEESDRHSPLSWIAESLESMIMHTFAVDDGLSGREPHQLRDAWIDPAFREQLDDSG